MEPAMNNKHNPSAEAAAISTDSTGLPQVEPTAALRQRAEEMANADEAMTRDTLSPRVASRLQHELRVS